MGELFGSKALELAISLALFFMLVSLICSAAREMIEAVMKTRAMDLERALRELLADPQGAGPVKQLFGHPMIAGLFRGTYEQVDEAGGTGATRNLSWSQRRQLPSYIPAGQFSAALVDLITRGAGETPYAPARPQGPVDLARLRADAARLADPVLRRAILAATDGATTLDDAKLRLEAWFNGSMDRAAGWYKRRTQWILLGLGFTVAVLMNLDSITVARRLFEDADLRQAAVRAAEARPAPEAPLTGGSAEAAASGPATSDITREPAEGEAAQAAVATPGATEGTGSVTEGTLGAEALAPTAATGNTSATSPDRTGASAAAILGLRQELADVGFPVGWTFVNGHLWPAAQAETCMGTPKEPRCANKRRNHVWAVEVGDDRVSVLHGGSLILMPLGWLATALAVTLGAPFWFDLLNKFILVRATVKPAQKSQDAASPERTLTSSPPGGDLVPGDAATVAAKRAPVPAPSATNPTSAPVPAPAEPFVINRWAIGADPDEGML